VDLEAHTALAIPPCRGSAVCSPPVGEDGEARPGVLRLRLCRVLVFYQGGRAECLWLPTELCSPFYPSAQGQSPVASRCPMPLSRPLWPGHPGERRPTVARATAVNSPTGQPPSSISSAPRFAVRKQPVNFWSRTFFFVINHAITHCPVPVCATSIGPRAARCKLPFASVQACQKIRNAPRKLQRNHSGKGQKKPASHHSYSSPTVGHEGGRGGRAVALRPQLPASIFFSVMSRLR